MGQRMHGMQRKMLISQFVIISGISTIRILVSAIMELPKNYLDTLKKRTQLLKITSERQELIQCFVDKINLERVGTKFAPATWKQINGLVGQVNIRDLYWLFKKCEQGDNFSKKFFGILKSTRVNTQQ